MSFVRLAPNTVSKQLLFSTVRVDTRTADESEGAGTAFVVCLAHGGLNHTFLVTNRHVVEGAVTGSLVFTCGDEGRPVVGRGFKIDIDDFEHAWFFHPNPDIDLAITPLKPLEANVRTRNAQIYYHAIDLRLIPTATQVEQFDALETVLFVGYPNGVWDKANLMPILRRGTTATAMALDFEARPEFLIDAAVYPGSSGSPVFLYDKDSSNSTQTLHFIGVISAVFFKEEATRLVSAPVPSVESSGMFCSEMIDLGLVIKSDEVKNLVGAYLKAAGL